MTRLMQEVKAFLQDEDGLTIVEYAVAGGLISAVVVVAFTALGDEVCTVIDELIVALGGAASGC